jgi:hypothetical protein
MRACFRNTNHNKTLHNILIAYDIRRTLLSSLSAYDVAKLNLSLGTILDSSERQIYLNPLRDVIWDLSETRALFLNGMKILLLGEDVKLLEKRLHDTKHYLDCHGHARKLRVYMVGYFPIRGKTTDILDRMVRFSILPEPCNHRIIKDKDHLRRIHRKLMDGNEDVGESFLMSFGAPAFPLMGAESSTWYKVSHIPERTVDLRVYVPCYYDRVWPQVRIPLLQMLRICGFFSGFACMKPAVMDLAKVCSAKYQFDSLVYLTSSGLWEMESMSQKLLLVDLVPSHFAPVERML